MDGVLPGRERASIATFDITAQVTNQVAGKNGGAPQTLTPAITLAIRADDANSATIKWGMGRSATDPLAKGEFVNHYIPAGYFIDLSELCVVGTANDLIHVTATVIQSVPPP